MLDGYNFGGHPEDGSSTFLQNVHAHLPKHMNVTFHNAVLRTSYRKMSAIGKVMMWKECQKERNVKKLI